MHVVMFGDQHVESLGGAQVSTRLQRRFLEKAGHTVTIVAANAVALPHLVHDGENGYLFEPGDIPALAARLTDVLTAAPEERLRMQQASLDGVIVHDINRTLDTFEALYRDEPLPE